MTIRALIRHRRTQSLLDAVLGTYEELAGRVPQFEIKLLSENSVEAWQEDWVPVSARMPPEGGWDWGAIYRANRRSKDEFCVAIWHGEELCGIAVLQIAKKFVESSSS